MLQTPLWRQPRNGLLLVLDHCLQSRTKSHSSRLETLSYLCPQDLKKQPPISRPTEQQVCRVSNGATAGAARSATPYIPKLPDSASKDGAPAYLAAGWRWEEATWATPTALLHAGRLPPSSHGMPPPLSAASWRSHLDDRGIHGDAAGRRRAAMLVVLGSLEAGCWVLLRRSNHAGCSLPTAGQSRQPMTLCTPPSQPYSRRSWVNRRFVVRSSPSSCKNSRIIVVLY